VSTACVSKDEAERNGEVVSVKPDARGVGGEDVVLNNPS
jgi:hypothetical protein